MSRSYRGVLAAAAGLAALFTAFGIGGYVTGLNQPDYDWYEPYRYAPDDPEAARSRLAEQPRAMEYRQPCRQPKGHDESDLCAQWKAARAAESSAFWAKWGVWITAAGAAGLIVTIMQGRLALERAREANEIARKDQRPWIKISLEPREQVIWRPDSYIVGGVGIVATNIGKDVAKIVGFKHRAVMPNFLFSPDDSNDGLPASSFQHLLPKDADEFFKPSENLPTHVSLLPGEPWSALQELDKPIDSYFVSTVGDAYRCVCIISVDVVFTYLWNGDLYSSICMFNLTLGDADNLGRGAKSPTTTDVPLGWIAFPSHVDHT